MPIPPKRTGPPRRLISEEEAAAVPAPPQGAAATQAPAPAAATGISRIPAPTRKPQAPAPEAWLIGGKPVSCTHCGSTAFELRKGDTNALVCKVCTRIEWFTGEPVFGPLPTPKIPAPRR